MAEGGLLLLDHPLATVPLGFLTGPPRRFWRPGMRIPVAHRFGDGRGQKGLIAFVVQVGKSGSLLRFRNPLLLTAPWPFRGYNHTILCSDCSRIVSGMEHLAKQIGVPTQDRAAYEVGIHGIVDCLALFPGWVLMRVVLAVNLLGDWRRAGLDPHSKRLTD